LSALINGLKGGSPVLIVDRGRPVARLEPVVAGSEGQDDGRLTTDAPASAHGGWLLKSAWGGMARRGRTMPSRKSRDSDALITERREGR